MSRFEYLQAQEPLEAMADRGLVSANVEDEARRLLETRNVTGALQLLT